MLSSQALNVWRSLGLWTRLFGDTTCIKMFGNLQSGSARGGSGIPICPKKKSTKYPKFLQIYPKIARVVIVACHDPPMSNYAYTCVIPKSTNHKFSGYQSYTINTVMYTSPLYPFVPFLMFFYLYKHEPTKFRTI